MQSAFNTVECLQSLARLGQADHQLATIKFVEIEGVRRLAHFEQNVVGCVGSVVNRLLREFCEAFLHAIAG